MPMVTVVIDTSVLSRLSPNKPPVEEGFERWLANETGTAALSAVTVMELHKGLANLKTRGATRRATALGAWLSELEHDFRSRILPVDDIVARTAGEMLGQLQAAGHDPGAEDALIAATALRHGAAVATTNVRHFSLFGVPHFDPTA